MIACDCSVCTSPDPRNKRTRASVHVVMDGLHVQVDGTPEFRLQCVQHNVTWIDLFILTHGHTDHVTGMDDLRRFCDLLGGKAMPVWSTPEGLGRVRAVYPYAILDRQETKGYPAFQLQEMPAKLVLEQGTIESTVLPHGNVDTLGLAFTERSSGKRFVYYTDCKRVTPEAVALARGADVLVLDALRQKPHNSHMSVGEAVAAAGEIGAAQTYFTHMTHYIDHERDEKDLPAGVFFAYDGLKLTL